MKRLKILIATAVTLLICGASYGQKIHFSGALQNMHLWRGLQVADGGVLSADLNVGFLGDGLKVGLWGGTDFTGDYKEFDYYASYSVAGFTVAVWDIYNYSPDLPYSKDIFNYNKYSTSHFLDLSVAYNFDTLLKVPLRVSWATIFAGRDLNLGATTAIRPSSMPSTASSATSTGRWMSVWAARLPSTATGRTEVRTSTVTTG